MEESMSDCFTCINFIRRKGKRKGKQNQKCLQNNPIKLSHIDTQCISLFEKCTDYILDTENWKCPINLNDEFVVTYHGLIEKIEIATVHSEEIAQKMCSDHNMTVPRHLFDCGIGHMSYIKKK
jgi:hypothetical protein